MLLKTKWISFCAIAVTLLSTPALAVGPNDIPILFGGNGNTGNFAPVASGGRRVAVSILLQDAENSDLRSTVTENVESIYQTFTRGVTHLTIRVRTNDQRLRSGNGLDGVGNAVRLTLQTYLQPNDVVESLLIGGHGQDLGVPGFRSSMDHLGSVSEFGVSETFKRAFQPLKGRMAQDGKIIFFACSFIRGSMWSREARVRAITDFFGNVRGRVSATETIQNAWPRADGDYSAAQRTLNIISAGASAALSIIFISSTIVGSYFLGIDLAQVFGTPAYEGFIAAIGTVMGMFVGNHIYHPFEGINKGRMYQRSERGIQSASLEDFWNVFVRQDIPINQCARSFK